MTWTPATMRWPEQSTQWLGKLDAAQRLADTELANIASRLVKLNGLATTSTRPKDQTVNNAVTLGRSAMAAQLSHAPACLTVTPFQPGVGQGQGYQRFLSAPNLIQLLGDRLLNTPDIQAFAGEQHALVVLFLSTNYERLAQSLARFNALMPVPDLVRTEKRAGHLSRLEEEKWTLPIVDTLPNWHPLPLDRCTFTQAAKRTISGQLAALESYTADSSPLGDLRALAVRKIAQNAARNQRLKDLQEQLANPAAELSTVVRSIGPGNARELRRQLLSEATPGHEWVLCAGLMLVGPLGSLSFTRELVGL